MIKTVQDIIYIQLALGLTFLTPIKAPKLYIWGVIDLPLTYRIQITQKPNIERKKVWSIFFYLNLGGIVFLKGTMSYRKHQILSFSLKVLESSGVGLHKSRCLSVVCASFCCFLKRCITPIFKVSLRQAVVYFFASPHDIWKLESFLLIFMFGLHQIASN